MIREYKKGDEIAIAAIEEECFSMPWSAQGIKDALWEGARFLVYEKDGEIVGYLGVRKILEIGFIYNVAVKEKYRRCGIGNALLEELDRLAEKMGLEELTLEVRESNSAAISLYTKMGYEADGIRPNFYENPRENAIIMTKRR